MARICFRPFNIGKWFVMGFCAFLSTCSETGNPNPQSFNRGGGGPGRRGGPLPGEFSLHDVLQFVSDHLGAVILGAVVVLILGIGLKLALLYLSCRGRLMLLDNVIVNRAAVVEPWHRLGPLAKGYFFFRAMIFAITTIAVLLIGTICMMMAWPDIRAEEFNGGATGAVLLAIFTLLPLNIVLAILEVYAYDFVVPIMMLRNSTFSAAWREAKVNVLRGHVGAIIVFYLLKFVFGICAVIVAMVAMCATLCIGALPYLSSVVLLPVFVFDRTYAPSFLEQFHPDYCIISDMPPPPTGFPVDMNAPPSQFP